eukprot:3933924-Rhodomonas_salina.2
MPSATPEGRAAAEEGAGARGAVCPTSVMTMYKTPFLNYANLAAVILHTASWVAIMALRDADNDVVYRLTHTITTWVPPDADAGAVTANMTAVHRFGNVTIYAHIEPTEIYLNLTTLITTFFMLSAGFQLAFTTTQSRMVEFFFSGTLVIVTICIQLGVYDAYTIMCIAFLSMTMMALGFVADRSKVGPNFWYVQSDPAERDPGDERAALLDGNDRPVTSDGLTEREKVAWIAHVVAWLPFLPVLITIIGKYATALAYGDNDPPDFVTWIVATEVQLLTMFGFVQTASLTRYFESRQNYIDGAFILLSLTAKLILGWIITAEFFIK